MAYKNQKKNRRHILELRKDPENWRNIMKRRKKKKKPVPQLTLEQMENMIARL